MNLPHMPQPTTPHMRPIVIDKIFALEEEEVHGRRG